MQVKLIMVSQKILPEFKNRLESFKKKNDLKGKDLAIAGNITPQSVSAYTDSNLPRAEVLAQWAYKFNLNINWLLTGEGEMLRSEQANAPPAGHGDVSALENRYREAMGEIDALRAELLALYRKLDSTREELLSMHRESRQEKESHGVVTTRASGSSTAAPSSRGQTDGQK